MLYIPSLFPYTLRLFTLTHEAAHFNTNFLYVEKNLSMNKKKEREDFLLSPSLACLLLLACFFRLVDS